MAARIGVRLSSLLAKVDPRLLQRSDRCQRSTIRRDPPNGVDFESLEPPRLFCCSLSTFAGANLSTLSTNTSDFLSGADFLFQVFTRFGFSL
jgi:hypothetical protein